MRKILFLLSFLMLFSFHMKGQNKSDFNIMIPDIEVNDSKYNKVYYVESRPNPDDMGFTYINAWHGMKSVTLSEPLESQIQLLIEKITNRSEDTKTIAVQMRTLFFDIGKDEFVGDGVCHLRITLYEKDDDKYYFLNTIDTTLVSGKKDIKETASNSIISFISDNLPYYVYDNEEALDMQQVMDIDVYEKYSIPFYTEGHIPDGIYYKYKSLMALTPDIPADMAVIKTEKGELKEVSIPDSKKSGESRKLKTKEVYAVVVGGMPYISFEGNFYKAYNKENDWRFVITQTIPRSGFSLGIGIGNDSRHVSGDVGIGIPIGQKKEKHEMFLDHLNGDFYWGGRIK